MRRLIDVFSKITSVEVTKTNKDCYTIWLINDSKLEIVLLHGSQFREIVYEDSSHLRDFIIEKQKSYWFVVEVKTSFKLFSSNLQTLYLELEPGAKIHLKEKSGTYEVVQVHRDKTVTITCNSWRGSKKLVAFSDIHCLAGGLVNFSLLNKQK